MAHLVVSVLQHVQFWMNSFHIWHKWSLEGVSHAMTSDLDIYLQGYLAVTLPVSWILFMCHKYNPWGDDDDLLYHFQVNRSKVGVIDSFEFLQLGKSDLQFLVYFDLLIPLISVLTCAIFSWMQAKPSGQDFYYLVTFGLLMPSLAQIFFDENLLGYTMEWCSLAHWKIWLIESIEYKMLVRPSGICCWVCV